MIRLQVLNILEKALDQKAEVGPNNVSFWCPVCKKEPYKKKLSICLNDESDKFGFWKCWVCRDSNDMGGRNLFKLLKKIGANKALVYDLSKIINVSYGTDITSAFDNVEKLPSTIELPAEFIPLSKKNKTASYQTALNYIKSRNIKDSEIARYNIGYCDSGKYMKRIIIPSYDVNGVLNYFVARSYEENWYPKYKNPPLPNNDYVIFFDIFINWDMPIVLVEGVFDAIGAKRNAIPLLGQSISSALQHKLMQRDVSEMVIALDPDAINTSLKYVEKFVSEGISVKFMDLGDSDPGEMEFKDFVRLYNKSSDMDFGNLIKLKMRV